MKYLFNTIRHLAPLAILLLVVFVVLGLNSTSAQVAALYNFKGRIITASSTPVADGTYDMAFGLYSQPTGGVAVWNESLNAGSRFSATVSGATVNADTITYNYSGGTGTSTLRVGQYLNSASGAVLVVDYDTSANTVTIAGTASTWANGTAINNLPRVTGGVIDIDLGTVTDLSTVNFNQPLYLQVTFNAEVMQPRKVFTSVANAFNANKLNGLTASSFANTTTDFTADGKWIFNNIMSVATSSTDTALTVTQLGAGNILQLKAGSIDVMTVLSNGNVAIGTTTADERLFVQGNIKWTGNLIPVTNGQTIGTMGTRIQNGFFQNLDVVNMTIASSSISGSISSVFTINSDNGTMDAEDSSLAFSRGAVGTGDALLTWDSTNKRFVVNYPFYAGANNIFTMGAIGIGTTTLATGGQQNAKLQVAGAIAANYYCDANGNNCFDASAGWGAGIGTFFGTTTVTTNGSFATSTLRGYQAGNNMCASKFSGSHFCSTEEIIHTIAVESINDFSGTAWVANGPPGYTANSNDCNGWTANVGTSLGAFWLFDSNGGGAGWLTNCSVVKPIACCK